MPSLLLPPPNRSPGVGPPAFFPKPSASIMEAPAVVLITRAAAPTVPVAVRLAVLVLPSSQIVLLPVRSVIPRLPAPSALPEPAEMIFHVCPPALLLDSASQVPNEVAPPTASGV